MEEVISWKGPEYNHIEKSKDWYLAVGIISVTAAFASVLLNNYIFAVFLILASITLMIFASKKPREVEISIRKEGVVFDRFFYDFDALESFWVTEKLPARILLKSKKVLMPLIVLPLINAPIDEIREFLAVYLKEEELYEPILQKIMEHVGF